jgi:hypothetical protein
MSVTDMTVVNRHSEPLYREGLARIRDSHPQAELRTTRFERFALLETL